MAGQTTYSIRKTFPLCSFKDILVYVLCNKVLNYLSVRLIVGYWNLELVIGTGKKRVRTLRIESAQPEYGSQLSGKVNEWRVSLADKFHIES